MMATEMNEFGICESHDSVASYIVDRMKTISKDLGDIYNLQADNLDQIDYKVLGVAPSGKIAEALQKSAIPAITSQLACAASKQAWIDVDSETIVVIINESGLIGVESFMTIVERSKGRGARVVQLG